MGLNKDILDQKYVSGNPEKAEMRQAYGEALLELGKKDKNIVVLAADLAGSTKTSLFAKEFPERFFQMGIAEQNMIATAVGLAKTGKVAFASSFAVFVPGRCWDQVRISMCYNKANVTITGNHAGLNVGEDGATHQALEDIAIARVIPNMTVIAPCDYNEMKKAVKAAAEIECPVYIRMPRSKTPNITSEKTPFKVGTAEVFHQGKDVSIIACGTMVQFALEAALALEKKGIKARVINCHTIKPIDEERIIKAARDTGAIVTFEEHQVQGGMGSAVAEVVARKAPVPIEMIGVQDKFGESGKGDELWEKHGLTAAGCIRAVKKVLKRK